MYPNSNYQLPNGKPSKEPWRGNTDEITFEDPKRLYHLVYLVPHRGCVIRTVKSFATLEGLEKHISVCKTKGWKIEYADEYMQLREWVP